MITAFHGSRVPVKRFSRKYTAQGVFWFSEDKDEIIRGGKGVAPVNYLMTCKLNVSNPAGWEEYEKLGLGQIESRGFDSIKLDEDWIVFDEKDIKVLDIEEIKTASTIKITAEKTKKELKEEKSRRQKKTKAVRHLASQIDKIRKKVSDDLKSKDHKTQITALAVALIDKTAERVGNNSSAKDGHFGVTGWRGKHITVSGSNITIKYVGKSGVEQEKKFSDAPIAKLLKECKGNCGENSPVLITKDGVRINAKQVNEYLKDYDVTAKDLRGYAANQLLVDTLSRLKKPSDPDERKEVFKKAIKEVAEKVGHQEATLQQHYLLPDMEDDYVGKGVVRKVKDASEGNRLNRFEAMLERVAMKSQDWNGFKDDWQKKIGYIYEELFDKPANMPEISLVVSDQMLPDGKVGSYKDEGILIVSPKAFEQGIVDIVIKHELCHAVIGEREDGHGEEFEILTEAIGIPERFRD